MGAHKVVFCYKEKKCGGKKDTHMEGASGKDITSHEKHQVLHTETVNNWHHVMSVDTIFPLPAWHINYKSNSSLTDAPNNWTRIAENY